MHAHELLGVERISGRPFDDRVAEPVVRRIPAEQRLDEVRGVLRSERPERHRERVPLASTPVRSPLEQLGPGARDDEERHVLDEIDEAVDEVEQPVVGPLEVVDHQHERSPLRQRFEKDPPTGEELATAVAETDVLRDETDERLEARCDPEPLRLRDEVGDFGRELRCRDGGVVVLVDAHLRLDDLTERPERDAVPVREAAAVPPSDDLLVLLDFAAELGHEAALADPRHADERHELRRAVDAHSRERAEEQRALVVAADERRGRLELEPTDPFPRLDRLPHFHGLDLALGLDRSVGAELDRALRDSVRRGRDEDPVDRRRGLDPGRGVHHVAGDHRLAGLRPGIDRHERLACRDADANVEVERLVAVVQLGDRVAGAERRAHRALGIVLMGRRGAVHRDDRVADELLDGAAVPFERAAQRLVVTTQERPHVLRVELLGSGGRADEVDEHRGHELALLPGGHVRGEHGTAAVAEPRVLGVLPAAARTPDHAGECMGTGRLGKADAEGERAGAAGTRPEARPRRGPSSSCRAGARRRARPSRSCGDSRRMRCSTS